MNPGLTAAVVISIIFLGIIGIIKAISEHQIKHKLINSGLVDTKSLKILNPPLDNRYDAMKWGLVAFFGGIALISLEFMHYSYESPFPYGVVLVGISLGFLIYYLLVRKQLNNNQNLES